MSALASAQAATTLSAVHGILYDSSPTPFASVSGDEAVRLWNVIEEGLGDWLGWEARRDAATHPAFPDGVSPTRK